MAEHAELIIVRRHEEEEHEAHSSAWKVAHADFMTAMMAFFLIMWLISVTDDEIRKGISEYFNPIRLSQGQTELKGLNRPTADANKPGVRKGHADVAPDVFNPMQLSQGVSDSKSLAENESPPPAVQPDAAAEAGAADVAEAEAGNEAGERAAFRDPYAILGDLATKYRIAHPVSSSTIVGDDRGLGIDGSEVDRDPFDPVYWQLDATPPARASNPGTAGTAKAPPEGASPDASGAQPEEPVAARAETAALPAVESVPGVAAAAEQAAPPASEAVAAETVTAATALGAEIAGSIAATLGADGLPSVGVEATPEGILINLTDDSDFSMFEIGSAIPNAKVVVLMEALGRALAAREGVVVVRGYTDGRPFRSDVYDNWRLSAARAHMAYYMLTRGGLDEKRVARIEGYADHDLRVKDDPYAAENRRIEILLHEAG